MEAWSQKLLRNTKEWLHSKDTREPDDEKSGSFFGTFLSRDKPI